ncbi:glutamate 5-kinase [Glaciecola sp. HTCC2999]|jgi:glutamate 5-kinase|uniref:glutamate 5-kinase n=1 Tax=Glaciecola sp. HTCC2999 TaxID=455436 RepID=UPI0000E0E874|nr:glutamate 5-kinase [Glaciecola sp. HTCC2999]
MMISSPTISPSVMHAKRVVIKVGSALIAPNRTGCEKKYLLPIAQFISQLHEHNIQVVLVSSGSVAAGHHLFKDETQPDLITKKAMAAAGQSDMMGTWEQLLDYSLAQLLITHADLKERERYLSVNSTLDRLLQQGIIPVVNENDSITTDRLKIGDNDNLSAMVASAVSADYLIICSDVDGLYTANPKTDPDATLIQNVTEITPHIHAISGGAGSNVGTGGMRTKIQAAEKATAHGIGTFIVNGFKMDVFNHLLQSLPTGTYFEPQSSDLNEAENWMTHTSKVMGQLVIHDDVVINDVDDSQSLNARDIRTVKGDFSMGDTVLICRSDGTRLLKATANYSSCLLSFVVEQSAAIIHQEFDNLSDPIVNDAHVALLI